MTLPTGENPISFSQIRTEFGDGVNTSTSPVRLGQYRSTDASFTNESPGDFSDLPLDTGIPTSGAINVDSFHGKRLNVIIDYYSGSTENRPDDARTKYQAASASGNRVVVGGYKDRVINDSSGSKVRIHVNKEIGSATGSVNNCAVRTGSFETGTVVTVEVGSSGAIYGAGGDGGNGGNSANGGDGGDGSSALGIQYSGTTVINNGSIIGGGGGGGGGGYRRIEKEEPGSSESEHGYGGGGGGGQGLPAGEGGTGPSAATDGADGTKTAGGAGGEGSTDSRAGVAAHGGGGGGGGLNGPAGEGGNENDGGAGTTSSGGSGAQGTNSGGSIESEENITTSGGSGGASGAAIRKTDGTITVNITNNGTISGADDATGVS